MDSLLHCPNCHVPVMKYNGELHGVSELKCINPKCGIEIKVRYRIVLEKKGEE